MAELACKHRPCISNFHELPDRQRETHTERLIPVRERDRAKEVEIDGERGTAIFDRCLLKDVSVLNPEP